MSPHEGLLATLAVLVAVCPSCIRPCQSPRRDLRDIRDDARSASAELLHGAGAARGWSRLLRMSLSSLPQAMRVVPPLAVRRDDVRLASASKRDPRALAVAIGRLSVVDRQAGACLVRGFADYVSTWQANHAGASPADRVTEMLLLSQLRVLDGTLGNGERRVSGEVGNLERSLARQLAGKDDSFWQDAVAEVPGCTCYVLVACVDGGDSRERGHALLARIVRGSAMRDWLPIELYLAASAASIIEGPTLYDPGGPLYRELRRRYLRLRTRYRLQDLATWRLQPSVDAQETEEEFDEARVIYLWLDDVLLFSERRYGRTTGYP